MFKEMLAGLEDENQKPKPSRGAKTITAGNNHGAIEDGAFARSQPGYVPPKPNEKRRFAVFTTKEAGEAAQVALLGTQGYANKSVTGVVDRYLGSGSENSSDSRANYKGYVAARLGIGANDPVPAEKRALLAQAMREFETGQRQPGVNFTPVEGNSGGGSGTAYRAPIQTQNAPDVSTVKPAANEVVAMGENHLQIRDPFKISPAIESRQTVTENRADVADNVLGKVMEGLDSIQNRREQALSQTLTAKRAISTEVTQNTQTLIDQARPLFQTREAISARRLELANMNPLARALHGTFDPNYNDTDLAGRDRAIASHLNVLNEDYQMLTGLQDNLGKLIDTEYNGQESMFKLQRENLTEDFSLASQSFAMSQQVLGVAMQGVENQTAILRAQQVARVDTLSKLSVGQINVAIDQAKASPNGYAVVNGVPLSMTELTASRDNYRDQGMALESRQLALESGRLGLASQYEDQAIAHMTPPQIEEAVKNGGSYNGQQLDMGKLTTAYGQMTARNAQQAESIAQNSAPGVMRNLIGGVRNQTIGTTQRMIGMMGAVPAEQSQLMGALSAEIGSIAEGFAEADSRGVGNQYAQANLPRLQALYKQQDEMISKTAQRWAGGNKEIQAVGEGWLRGTPVSGDTAARGLIQMARTGVPAGTRLSGPAAQTFAMVQQIVKAADTPAAGQTIEQMMGSPENQRQRDRRLQQQVQSAVGEGYTNYMVDAVLKSTPELAHQVLVNGQSHPFNRVNPTDFANAIAYGDQDGLKRLATQKEVGLDAPTLEKIFSEGINGPTWQATKQSKGWADSKFGELGRSLTAMQTQSAMQALDASGSARPGFKPSAAFADLMQNQQYQQQAMGIVNKVGQGSFGDFMVSGVAGPGFAEAFTGYTGMVRNAYVNLNAATMSSRVKEAQSMMSDGWTKTQYILNGMEGLTRQDSDQLISAIRPLVGTAPRITDRPVPDGHDNVDFRNIHDVIMNHKFENPAIERIRQRAMRQWPQISAIFDRINANQTADV